MENTIIEWQAKEFEHYEKGSGWYITLAIIIFLLLAYEILLRDWFAALTILIMGIVVWWFSKQKPEDVDVTITDKGIGLNGLYIPFHNIKRFWIVDHDQARALHFETNAYLNRFIIVQLNDQDPETIAEILRNFIPEGISNHESVSHRIARKLKF